MSADWRAEILARLADGPFAARVRVFGSAADAGADPKDVDVLVDGTSRKEGSALLGLAREFYGRFDPFVLQHGVLWVRSDDATGWIRARNAAAILRAAAAGITLAEAIANASRAPSP